MNTRERATLADRAIGALIGLAVGDALGDLGRRSSVRSKLGLVTELLPDARSTDDTEFTVLAARAFLSNASGYSPAAVANTWRELVIDRGGALDRAGVPLYGALWNLAHGIDPPLSGHDNVLSSDDGAAMRAVPFGILRPGAPRKARELAAIDACVSHSGDGIAAAEAVVAAVSVAVTGAEVADIVAAAGDSIPSDSWLGRRMAVARGIVETRTSVWAAYSKLHTELWTPKHSAASEAIPQVFGLLSLSEGDLATALVLAANFGRDSDTICSLVLAMCCARLGAGAIPPEWIDSVRRPAGVCLPFAAQEDLVDLAADLSRHALCRGEEE